MAENTTNYAMSEDPESEAMNPPCFGASPDWVQYENHVKPEDQRMTVDGKLLEILCCPVSKVPLNRLGHAQLDKLNKAIAAGSVSYVHGENVRDALQEALITDDGKVIYPVQDDIPILLEEKGIGTTQLQDF